MNLADFIQRNSTNMNLSLIMDSHEMNEMKNENTSIPLCQAPVDVSDLRFVMVVCICTPLALLGLVMNILTCRYFYKDSKSNGPSAYLFILSGTDVLMCLCYVFLFTMDALAVYFKLEWLWFIWHYYVIPFYAISRMAELVSAYIIVFASFGRLVLVSSRLKTIPCLRTLTTNQFRVRLICVIVLCCVLLRMITFWELSIETRPNCTVQMSWLYVNMVFEEDKWFDIWDLYVLQFIQIFVPFLLLIVLNTAILATFYRNYSRHIVLRMGDAEQEQIRNKLNDMHDRRKAVILTLQLMNDIIINRAEQQRKRSVQHARMRAATIALIELITTYLICNSVNLFIKMLEKIPPESNRLLYTEVWNEEVQSDVLVPTSFYTIGSDSVSLLVMLNSTLRPFIFFFSEKGIRRSLLKWNQPIKRMDSVSSFAMDARSSSKANEASLAPPKKMTNAAKLKRSTVSLLRNGSIQVGSTDLNGTVYNNQCRHASGSQIEIML